MVFLRVVFIGSLAGVITAAGAMEPKLDLTLPSTTLLDDQKPAQLFGKPNAKGQGEGLHIIHAVTNAEQLSLTLTQAIALALQHNTEIRTTYMQRISQRYQFYLDKRNRELWNFFKTPPSIAIESKRDINQASGQLTGDTSSDGSGANGTTITNTYSVTPAFSFVSPIGTQINVNGEYGQDKNLQGTISITQPLLKGFGYDINKIDWETSKLTEAGNVLGLRTSVSSTILQVIQSYRSLISASLTYQSNQQALKEAEETLENTEIQVKAGRLARSELLSSKIQVQSAKNQLLSSENQIKQQQQDFATLLGLKKAVTFKVDDKLTIPDITLNEKQLIDYALQNKPDYLQRKIGLQKDKLNLKQAEDNKLWDLSLTASAGRTQSTQNRYKQNDYQVGLSLTVPLDNSDQKKAVLDAKIAVENDKLNLQQAKLKIISDIHNNVSTLEQSYKALKIQEQQLKLQQEQVDNTQLQLKYGRASAYDLAQQQQQLNDSRNQLISSKIGYLNQLSQLDDYLGTALATWQVVLAP